MQTTLLTAVIPAGATGISAALDLNDSRLGVIYVPAGWLAANITFQVSHDGATFANLYDSTGAEYTVTAAASRAIAVPLADFLGARYVKLRSGTSGGPVNQTGAPSLVLALVP
jgi:hypothetical protein